MTLTTTSPRTLISDCNTIYAATGTIGYVALLSDTLAQNLATTVVSATDTLTTATAHGLVTGSRVRLASAGTIPTPLVTTTDYYAIVLSATTLKLAASADYSLTATAIDLTDAGSGSITLNEQELLASDLIAVLINKEFSHPARTARNPISNVGTASLVGSNAEKASLSIAISNTNATPIAFKHVWLIFGASVTAAIGSVAGIARDLLETESTAASIALNETKALTIKLQVRSV